MLQDCLFRSLWSVDAEAVHRGGDFEWPDGLDMGSVEGPVEPGNVRVFEPTRACVSVRYCMLRAKRAERGQVQLMIHHRSGRERQFTRGHSCRR